MFNTPGQLAQVQKLKSATTPSTIQISWEPPFSHNLSATDPDIVYCVDIFRGTANNHIVSNCNVFEHYFIFSSENPDPRESYTFTVTPRSNVNRGRNGTVATTNTTYSYNREFSSYTTVNYIASSPTMFSAFQCC